MQPTPAFTFPEDARDAIDQKLRETTAEQAPVRSVRAPIVRPSMVEEKPTVPVKQASPTPKSEAEAISIDLPSKFHYYDFKDLYVKPLRIPQLAKIAKSHETGSLQTQAEAISSLLSTSSGDDKDLAFKLTMADYQAVLYWLRLTSFSKPQMRITSRCEDEKHNDDVRAGIKDVKTLEIHTTFTKSDLTTKDLEHAPDPAVYQITVDEEEGSTVVRFRPETLADTIEFLDHKDWLDEEFQYKSRIAAVLGLEEATGKKWTWDQRIQFVDQVLTPDQALLALEFADMLDEYGVIESVETKCMGCGSKGVAKVTCDPLSFLSPKF